MACRTKNRGFTLLELIVTVAVAAIIFSFGVPSFMDVARNGRAAANANEFVTAFSIARSEAVKRGARVTVCASKDGATCSGDWSDGWIVIADGAASDDADPPVVDDVLRTWPAPAGDPAIAAPANADWVRFLPRGSARTPAPMPVTFTMKVAGCSDLQGRSIELNAVGRTTVSRVACP